MKDSIVISDIVKIDATANMTGTVIDDLLITPLLHYDQKTSEYKNILLEGIRNFSYKKIELRLRRGVRFHDGKEMTSSEVAACFNKTLKTDRYLKEKYPSAEAAVLDKFSLTITSEDPIIDVNDLLTHIYIYSTELIGTGPFAFHSWIDNGVELMANDYYFEGKPKIKKIVYLHEEDERKRVTMLLKGEADLLAWLSPEMAGFLREDDKFYVKEWPAGFYSAIFLNNESSLFSDKVLRKAISMAIDRDKLIKKVLKGGGLKTLTPLPSQLLHTENSTDYRPREAIRLLKDAGWRDADGDGILEKNGKKLMFRLYYDINVEEFKKMADLISQDLFEIGIGVEAIPANMDESTGRSFEGGNYDAILLAKSFGDSVNIAVWGSSSHKNLSRFRNMEMDNLLNGLKSAADIEQKKEIYGRMKRIFKEEAPAVFLYNPVIYTAASKRFKGAEDFVGYVYSIYKIKDWSVN